jgi:hypothetical protein
MTLAETMDAIERDEFAAEMNLAAGTKAFRRAMKEHSLFRYFCGLAKDSLTEVAARIETISHLDVDERYENRLDTALSAYMMALANFAEPEVVSKAASAVLRTPRCWWASGISREMLLQTVAFGVVGTGQAVTSVSSTVQRIDWEGAFHIDVASWYQMWVPRRDESMRRLLRDLRAGQPSGQGNKVIKFPSEDDRTAIHQPNFVKSLKRKRGPSPPNNIAKARKQA